MSAEKVAAAKEGPTEFIPEAPSRIERIKRFIDDQLVVPKLLYIFVTAVLYAVHAFKASLFVDDFGFTLVDYGLRIASLDIILFFGSMFWGHISDRHGRHKLLITVSTIGFVGTMCLLLLQNFVNADYPEWLFTFVVVVSAVANFLSSGIFPLVDTLVLSMLSRDTRFSKEMFGRQRLAGALSHAAVTMIASRVQNNKALGRKFAIILLIPYGLFFLASLIFGVPNDLEIVKGGGHGHHGGGAEKKSAPGEKAVVEESTSTPVSEHDGKETGGARKKRRAPIITLLTSPNFVFFIFFILVAGYVRSLMTHFQTIHVESASLENSLNMKLAPEEINKLFFAKRIDIMKKGLIDEDVFSADEMEAFAKAISTGPEIKITDKQIAMLRKKPTTFFLKSEISRGIVYALEEILKNKNEWENMLSDIKRLDMMREYLLKEKIFTEEQLNVLRKDPKPDNIPENVLDKLIKKPETIFSKEEIKQVRQKFLESIKPEVFYKEFKQIRFNMMSEDLELLMNDILDKEQINAFKEGDPTKLPVISDEKKIELKNKLMEKLKIKPGLLFSEHEVKSFKSAAAKAAGLISVPRMVSEVAIYFFGKQLLTMFGPYWMLLVSQVAGTLRIVGYGFLPIDPTMMNIFAYVFEMLKGVNSGLFVSAATRIVSDIAPEGCAGSAQTMFSSVYVGVSSMLAGVGTAALLKLCSLEYKSNYEQLSTVFIYSGLVAAAITILIFAKYAFVDRVMSVSRRGKA